MANVQWKSRTFAPAFEHWKDGRVVDYTGLENRRTETCRGFESLSFRQEKPLYTYGDRDFSLIEIMSYEYKYPRPSKMSFRLGHTQS